MATTINDFGALQKRQTKKKDGTYGKARYTVTIDAKPITVKNDPKALGKGPAEAIAAHLQDRMQHITTAVAPATQAIREAAKAKLAAGTASAYLLKRYKAAKGETSAYAVPAKSNHMFNDSGKFMKGIVARLVQGKSYTINVPAARLNPDLLRGAEALTQIFAKLIELIPEFGSAKKMADVLSVRRAVKAAVAKIDSRVGKGSNIFTKELSINDIINGYNDIASLAG